jgi:tetratricopeptide (TPR) repeat protein
MSNTRITRLYEFLEEDPDDPFVRFALAAEYRKIGEDEQALQWLEQLIVDRPDYVGTYYHLGKLYQELGRFTEAREIFDRGIETASSIHDFHTISELRSARMELEESTDELVQ